MSKDFKLEKICDHRIIQEQLQIEDDRKTLRIPRTLASQQVNLWINGYEIEKDHAKFGWSIQDDETSIYTKRSKIVLDYARKSTSDFYFVDYSALPQYCPKCKGLRIHNDFSFSRLGKLVTVANEEKLLQQVKKGLTTELGSNPFHEWIGTEIYTLIGSKVVNIEAIKARIIQEINRYLEKYLDVQVQQTRYQEVTDREAFLRVLAVEVEPQYDTDISYWVITVIFRNREGEDLLYEKKIEIPGPTNLLYGD